MGIYYGDTHYGIKISKKIISEDGIFFEPMYEILFDDSSNSLLDYVNKIASIYKNLLQPEKYHYELYVDIITTYNGINSCRGWQIITTEQMINFIDGKYKIDFL
jgi:hypothetical protein